MEVLLHFLKVFKKTKIAQIYYYDPQSAGINLQSTQSDSTPWTLTNLDICLKKYKMKLKNYYFLLL